MERNVKLICLTLIMSMILNISCSTPGLDIAIVNVRCEYLEEPLGINTPSPRFTWEYGKTSQNFIQKAWQIRVASTQQLLDEGKPDIWVSDKVTHNFPRAEYCGNQPLAPHGRYYWNVTVWDNKGNSIVSPSAWFEMGKSQNHSEPRRVGSFSCSNPHLNKIWETTNQWAADAQVNINLALLNFDGITYYEKQMNDLLESQESGCKPELFIIPDALLSYYGEGRCIQRLYPTMQKYLNHLKTQENEKKLATDFTSSLSYYLVNKLMSRFATLLGNDAIPYIDKAGQLRDIINRKYYDFETGLYANATQNTQALPLFLKIVPKGQEQLVADNLYKMVVANNYLPDSGLYDSKALLPVLTKFGYVNAAYQMTSKASSIESADQEFMDEISTWMYNALAGINFEKAKPGFEHIIIKPHFIDDLQWVKGNYNSVWGMIESEWKRKENRIELTVRIPAGTTATIYADKEYSVGSGLYTFSWKI